MTQTAKPHCLNPAYCKHQTRGSHGTPKCRKPTQCKNPKQYQARKYGQRLRMVHRCSINSPTTKQHTGKRGRPASSEVLDFELPLEIVEEAIQ